MYHRIIKLKIEIYNTYITDLKFTLNTFTKVIIKLNLIIDICYVSYSYRYTLCYLPVMELTVLHPSIQ